LKLWRLPQNRRFYSKIECLHLWPTYTCEKGRTLGKTYGIKYGVIGNTPGEHIENLRNILGTHWELEKNTCWEQRENEKNPPLTPSTPHTPSPLKLKRKKMKVP